MARVRQCRSMTVFSFFQKTLPGIVACYCCCWLLPLTLYIVAAVAVTAAVCCCCCWLLLLTLFNVDAVVVTVAACCCFVFARTPNTDLVIEGFVLAMRPKFCCCYCCWLSFFCLLSVVPLQLPSVCLLFALLSTLLLAAEAVWRGAFLLCL